VCREGAEEMAREDERNHSIETNDGTAAQQYRNQYTSQQDALNTCIREPTEMLFGCKRAVE
jgi:hypothetical protein